MGRRATEQPIRPFAPPQVERFRRQRVSQPKRHEIGPFSLSPMGQVARQVVDWLIWVEVAKFVVQILEHDG